MEAINQAFYRIADLNVNTRIPIKLSILIADLWYELKNPDNLELPDMNEEVVNLRVFTEVHLDVVPVIYLN